MWPALVRDLRVAPRGAEAAEAMIRLIRIGGQIMEGNEDFAFWDTVRDKFVEIDGETVFDSREQFEEYASTDDGKCWIDLDRLRGFLDNAPWVRPDDPGED